MNNLHCVSLEIAKQLKESGWKKETEFCLEVDDEEVRIVKYGSYICSRKYYLAPLSDEILEELPENTEIKKVKKGYYIYINSNSIVDKSLPNALAEMWIFLKKGKL